MYVIVSVDVVALIRVVVVLYVKVTGAPADPVMSIATAPLELLVGSIVGDAGRSIGDPDEPKFSVAAAVDHASVCSAK